MKPLLSIVLCTYHRGVYLDSCIKNIVSLPYNNIEILIIADDPNYDNTKIVCDRYKKNDSRIRINYSNSRRGFIGSYMKGLELSQGIYVMPISDEDKLNIESFYIIWEELLKKHSNAIFFQAANYSKNNSSPALWSKRKPGWYETAIEAYSIDYIPIHVHYSGYILKKDAIDFDKCSMFNKNNIGHYWQQVPIIISVTKKGKVRVIDKIVIYCSTIAETEEGKLHDDTILGGDGFTHPIAWITSIKLFKTFIMEIVEDEKIQNKALANLIKTYFLRQTALFRTGKSKIKKSEYKKLLNELREDTILKKHFENFFPKFRKILFEAHKSSNSRINILMKVLHRKLTKNIKKVFPTNIRKLFVFYLARKSFSQNKPQPYKANIKDYENITKIKILHFNTKDIKGGAALGTYFLFNEQKKDTDLSVMLLVRDKLSSDKKVISYQRKVGLRNIYYLRNNIKLMPIYYPPIKTEKGVPFKIDWGRNPMLPNLKTDKLVKSADLLHLHWVCWGYIRPADLLYVKKPIIWTLRDMWPYTGGCHFSEGCEKYIDGCYDCKYVLKNNYLQLPARSYKSKLESFKNLELTLVAPSPWIAETASRSKIFSGKKIVVIPNGIDTNDFRSYNKEFAREDLNIPQNAFVISFGAVNGYKEKRKGYDLLIKALQHYEIMTGIKPYLLTFGRVEDSEVVNDENHHRRMGYIESSIILSKVYSASDVYITPAREESFGKTIAESLSCSTPVVAFKASGQQSLIEHKTTGYLAMPYDYKDLAVGMEFIRNNPRIKESGICRIKCQEKFDIKIVAKQYKELYYNVVEGKV